MAQDLASLLSQLADEGRPVRSLNLIGLSDLGRDELADVRTAWQALSAARRRDLVSAMVEQAEANIHMNFHAILRSCLADEDARVRRTAIEGLWEDERVSLVQPLVDRLAGDPAADVRAAAAIALGRFVLLGALGEIEHEAARLAEEALHAAWLRSDEPPDVRRRALEGLACSEAPVLPKLIEAAYFDEDEQMRQSALYAMGRSADPRWVKYVIAELASPEPPMRFEAAGAAGEMGLRKAVQPLIERLDDADGHVREAAALALGKIGGPVARRALEAVLDDDDERLAQAAEEALAELMFAFEDDLAGLDDDDLEAGPDWDDEPWADDQGL